ncbi:MAG: 5-formyltetrahydrofolate cyclo-ligase, partial [Firmicutes bacterium]|nr:5-formyltetrahydrofolate cyclo-ligase [Bacillota bacterium]
NELRELFKAERLEITDKKEKSKTIMEKIIASPHYKTAKVITVYAALPFEVDTSVLIRQAYLNHKVVAFPKVENNDLAFYKVGAVSELTTRGPLNIKEPVPSPEHLVHKNEIDLIIVPGICFDKKKYRIGYGKGFYDRYLIGNKAHTIGVCFKEQIYEKEIPINAQDIAVDEVISQ